jgi:RNA polymerase sigma-70 factor, ECF subfamily
VVDDDAARESGIRLIELYDVALPHVYGYLIVRCGSVALAEDLSAETFLAAVEAARRAAPADISVAWLIGVARHKLADHWRRQAREERRLELVSGELVEIEDPWDRALDTTVARDVLAGMGGHHRAALTLRYLDGLPVPEVAGHLDRTVHATEALLVRARRAFRAAYGERSER